jgi:hypothetical protein
VAGRRVVERRRDHVLHADLMLVRDRVELAGRDAGAHVRRQMVEQLGREPSRDAHLRDLVGRFDLDGHRGAGVEHGQARRSSLMLVFARVFASTRFTMTAQ